MTHLPSPAAGRHTLVLDLGAADGAAARWVTQAAAQGDRLVLAVREAAWQRDWMPFARDLGVPVLAPVADGASGLARTVRHALLPLGERVDQLVLVLDLPMPAAAQLHRTADHPPADWARSEVEACLQALQQGCIRLAELAHWCEPALRRGSQVRVLALQQGHPALRAAGLDVALALSLSSTLRYLDHGLGPRGVQVDLLPPPPAAGPAHQTPWSAGLAGVPDLPRRPPSARRVWRLGAATRPPAHAAAPSTLAPPPPGAARPSTLP